MSQNLMYHLEYQIKRPNKFQIQEHCMQHAMNHLTPYHIRTKKVVFLMYVYVPCFKQQKAQFVFQVECRTEGQT